MSIYTQNNQIESIDFCKTELIKYTLKKKIILRLMIGSFILALIFLLVFLYSINGGFISYRQYSGNHEMYEGVNVINIKSINILARELTTNENTTDKKVSGYYCKFKTTKGQNNAEGVAFIAKDNILFYECAKANDKMSDYELKNPVSIYGIVDEVPYTMDHYIPEEYHKKCIYTNFVATPEMYVSAGIYIFFFMLFIIFLISFLIIKHRISNQNNMSRGINIWQEYTNNIQ